MNAIENILKRNSPRELVAPHPTEEEMNLVFNCALRAPDHAWLRPSRFIQVTGDGLVKLSEIFQDFARENINDLTDITLEKYKNAPFRAPMVIIVISNIRIHPKVPEVEQLLSTSAATQNILLALHALGYGGIWRTGKFALNEIILKYLGLDQNQRVLGYLYVGKISGRQKKLPKLDISQFVQKWS